MEPGRPSLTALGAARHRAVHQELEHGSIFADPLAIRILGDDFAEALREAESEPARRRLRLFIAVRTRFAEDRLKMAVEGGATQLVVLGAGLDTYAYRSSLGARLGVFEVDHPSTQEWKRARLASAGIEVPPSLTFTPVDFERESLADGLTRAGLDPAKGTFFTWLGVVPYLTKEAIDATLRFIAGLPGGGEVVFDYSTPMRPADAPDEDRARLQARVAAVGESFKSFFEPAALAATLKEAGFEQTEDLGPAQIRERYFGVQGGREGVGHVVWAGRAR